MRVSRIDVHGYDLTYRYGQYVMSGGQVVNSLPSTVVRLRTDEGPEGFGEVCPLGPLYLASHGLGARAAIEQMMPALIGLDPTNLSAMHQAMDRALDSIAVCWRLYKPVVEHNRHEIERDTQRLNKAANAYQHYTGLIDALVEFGGDNGWIMVALQQRAHKASRAVSQYTERIIDRQGRIDRIDAYALARVS